MKKLMFLSVTMSLLMGLNAQIPNLDSAPRQWQSVEKVEGMFAPFNRTGGLGDYTLSKPQPKQKSNVTYTEFGYISNAVFAEMLVPYTCDKITNLFPDSMAFIFWQDLGSSANSGKYSTFASTGFIFDPYSLMFDVPYFNRGLFLDDNGVFYGYRLDTLLVPVEYRMANYNAASPDTLRFHITDFDAYKDTNAYGIDFLAITWSGYNAYGLLPKVQYPTPIPQKGVGPVLKSTNKITIDYILSDNDSVESTTAGYFRYKALCVPIPNGYAVPSKHCLGVVMQYIPGYSYNLNDTLGIKTVNTSTGAWISDVVRKNSLGIAAWDSPSIDYLLDYAGYNTFFMEDYNVRYAKDPSSFAVTNSVYEPGYNLQSAFIMHLSVNIPAPIYTIQGTIRNNGNPLAGITITCSNGNSAITDINGNYTITVDSGETVTLTPSSKYSFTPPFITCPNVANNLTNQNFTAIPFPKYTIQGYVSYEENPLEGVTITCTNGETALTDVSGNYTITAVDSSETVTITATMSGFNFIPPSIICPDITGNLTNQDFTAALPTYTIQGRVRLIDGNPLPGVTIDCTNGNSGITDETGEYVIPVTRYDSVVLTASLEGYTFKPLSFFIENITSNYTNVNFTASGVGIATITGNAFVKMYPNPAANQLRIESGDKTIDKLDIIDITGKIVKTYHFNSPINTVLDISELPNGIYFAAFYSKEQKTMRKLVKYSSEP